ncbi:type II toxin-antitoxin system TacA family antitoxin [Moraxella nonliquefaciens]|uniref:DUF1778 domain-containing protein n=1 Tax=Moraxella nonliquefaciens TaxID=478 RepID=A0A1B8QI40_MORNO|nr:DUF1778 domain-containing protein [Moraxella nonliquefaciens]OBX83148.1 hypothetical protein A7456_03565 [Moraxella nonliquefaciens]QPT43646.1 DUF1778 domain-containing protein [Moraxella nonliquefaciens]QQC30548.1 DUF1778 domain-containing protein [Moraxella nonliquefaciens]
MQATERISIRTTPHAKAVIEQASEQMGVSMSHFILTTMYQKSLELLQKGEQVSEIWQIDNDQGNHRRVVKTSLRINHDY